MEGGRYAQVSRSSPHHLINPSKSCKFPAVLSASSGSKGVPTSRAVWYCALVRRADPDLSGYPTVLFLLSNSALLWQDSFYHTKVPVTGLILRACVSDGDAACSRTHEGRLHNVQLTVYSLLQIRTPALASMLCMHLPLHELYHTVDSKDSSYCLGLTSMSSPSHDCHCIWTN